MPPVAITTESNTVASCQGAPPCANGVTPAALNLSSSAMNSSQLCGAVPPALSYSDLLSQTQLVEWTLTGAAIHLPLYLENACSAGGTTLSQPFFSATALMSASV